MVVEGAYSGMDVKVFHDRILPSQVRIMAKQAGGSGTIVGSFKNEEGGFSTYILSCEHVTHDLVKVETKWDAVIGKDRKREIKSTAMVVFFEYGETSYVDRMFSSEADVVAYDVEHDMALLKLRSKSDYSNRAAKLVQRERIKELFVGTPIVAIGCQLLHDPIVTVGQITHKGDEIDHKEYWMANALIIYGSSGGAVFTESGEYIGIPSRIDVTWNQAHGHLGYFSPPTRIYQFLEEQCFRFIYDPSYTEKQCYEERRKKQEEARLEKEDTVEKEDSPQMPHI